MYARAWQDHKHLADRRDRGREGDGRESPCTFSTLAAVCSLFSRFCSPELTGLPSRLLSQALDKLMDKSREVHTAVAQSLRESLLAREAKEAVEAEGFSA